jgi:ribosomal protein L16/L10AE
MLRKILKRFRRVWEKQHLCPQKLWFWLRKNYVISKKSKNARMGKGKGKFVRYAIKLPQGYMILEFRRWSVYYVKAVTKKFSKRINLPLNYCARSYCRERSTFINPNYCYEFVNRYA